MTPENFCYWLQGYLEVEQPTKITAEKVQQIKNHLDLVFEKKTPRLLCDVHPYFGVSKGSVQIPETPEYLLKWASGDGPVASC